MAHGGACLKLHADESACYSLQEGKIVNNLEESMGWGYNDGTSQITYGNDQCIWPKYGLAVDGAEIVGANCKSGKTDQKWIPVPLDGDHDGYYQYKHKDSNRCMALKNNKVVLQKCNPGDGKQHWNFGGIGSYQ